MPEGIGYDEDKVVYEEASEIMARFEQYKASADQWRQNVSEDMSFITPGGMWAQEQVNALRDRGQAPIEIPIITPQIELQKSQIIGRQPAFKVLPRTDTDVKKGKLISELCTYVWQLNEADMAVDDVVTNQLSYGKGYFYIGWDPEGDDGYGSVTIDSKHPLSVVVDPNSQRRDEEDASYKYCFGYFSARDTAIKYPEYAELIKSESGSSKEMQFTSVNANTQDVELYDNINDPGDSIILTLEEFTKQSIPFYIVKYDDGENRIEREMEEAEWEILKAEIEKDPRLGASITGIDKRWRTRVIKTTVLGSKIIDTETLPTQKYPLIPVSYRHYGNPYAISLTRFMKGLQQEVNHRRSLMIAHATASTNNKVLLPRGSVTDSEKFQVDWGRPNAVLEFDPTYGTPVVSQPIPLSNSYFQLEMAAKKDAEYIAGAFGMSHGDPSDAPETKGATMMLDDWASRRAGITARYLYNALNTVGRLVIDYIQFYMREPRVIRIVNPYDQYEEEMINIGIGDKYTDEDIQSIGDPSVGKYDVVIIIGSMAPSNRYAEAQFYMEALKAGAIDRTEYLKKTDVFDKAGVLKRMGEVQQLQNALEQQNQQMEQMNSTIKDLSADLNQSREAQLQTKREVDYDKKEMGLEDRYQRRMLIIEERINELDLMKKEVRLEKEDVKKENRATPEKG